ncbi:MAG: hypothetical protein ACNA8P_12395, partial [Phycisphaerales bacterium]
MTAPASTEPSKNARKHRAIPKLVPESCAMTRALSGGPSSASMVHARRKQNTPAPQQTAAHQSTAAHSGSRISAQAIEPHPQAQHDPMRAQAGLMPM